MLENKAKRSVRGWSILAVVAVALIGCSSPTRPADVPETHTVEKGGAFHAPGLKDPTSQCATCHGPNLAGGTEGEPSCFSCHGQKWD
jgi:mono/diheme cytochrome c family protein